MAVTKPVVLVGPMGVGKSTIGKKLAKRLATSFIDSDHIFVNRFGDISSFFETKGEAAFRAAEEDIILEHLAKPVVLATGGGAVLSEKVREALSIALVVYLYTDGRHLSARLAGGNRPLIREGGMQAWRKIYESRKHLYEQCADLTVDTSGLGLAQSVEMIVTELEKRELVH